MAHLPPTDPNPAAGTPLPQVLLNFQSSIVVGLGTLPVDPEQITDFAQLFDEDFPEPSATTLPGYARWQGRWAVLDNTPQVVRIQARPFFGCETHNPPAPIEIASMWTAVAVSGGGEPALLSVRSFDPPILIDTIGQGVISLNTITAAQPAGAPAPSLSVTSNPAVVQQPTRIPRAGRMLTGQDRRMAEEVLTVLQRALGHDERIPLLSANTRRSSIPLLDPTDATVGTGTQDIIARMQLLLAL